MIKPPSLFKDYTLIFSGDPALDLPDFTPVEASDEDKQKAIDARILALKNARDTGQWPLKQGESPTLFHFASDPGLARDYFDAEVQRAHARKKPLSVQEMAVIAFRIMLRKVENAGGLKVEFEDVDGYRIVSAAFVEKLYAIPEIGRMLVQELGSLAFERMIDPLPFT